MYERSSEGTTGYSVTEGEGGEGKIQVIKGGKGIRNMAVHKMLTKKKNGMKLR